MIKTALVTGASRGIGKSIAQKLSKKFNVVINYNNNESLAKSLAEEINQNGGCAKVFKADVTNIAEADNMAKFIISEFGRIDVLINNAGIAQQKVFGDITTDEWNNMINVNLNGMYNVTSKILPHMINAKSGKIINISSVWGICGASCEVHYSAAKSGVIGFTKALAKEVALSGITVNAVAPGVIKTDMCDFDDETIEMIKKEIPLGRIGNPCDVANAVEFLSSDLANYITGEVINVSGGYVI